MTNIYFIQGKDSIKIGRSEDVVKRQKELQVANSERLNILYIIENVEESFETHIHGICENYHISGEWFKNEALNHLLRHPWFKENMKSYTNASSFNGINS
jgi:hypothetical protein